EGAIRREPGATRSLDGDVPRISVARAAAPGGPRGDQAYGRVYPREGASEINTRPSDLENPEGKPRGFAVAGRDFEGRDQDRTGLRRVDDLVDPAAGAGVSDIGLAVVLLAQVFGHGGELGGIDLFALALQDAEVDVEHGSGGLLRPHDS